MFISVFVQTVRFLLSLGSEICEVIIYIHLHFFFLGSTFYKKPWTVALTYKVSNQ